METQDNAWWRTGVFYNIYVRSFKDADRDGIGDLTGVIDKLDYLGDVLGVDVLVLPGILQSPWKEFGFDVSDFHAVHPAFGGIETFDELLSRAHDRGMKVLIDFLSNHTSREHLWFIESRSSRDNPKRDWYIWRDPKPDGTPPNNWLSVFGGSAWEWDAETWQYYLHSFLPEQPDLNWANPELRAAMFDVARFWLDRGVDGFRVDAAHHIGKHPDLPDNPPTRARVLFGKKYAHEFQRHEFDREHPALHNYYRELRQVIDEFPSRFIMAEIHISQGWQAWAEYYGPEGNEFHFPLNPSFIPISWKADEVRKAVDQIEEALPRRAWPNAHLGNFDEWRAASRFGDDGARQAALLLLSMRGTPMLYYGDEIGMTNVPIAPAEKKDVMGSRIGLSRDPQRTPMQWDPGPHAGFSPFDAQPPWLPVGSNFRRVNVESELADPRSILNLHRRLIRVRRETPALVHGNYRAIDGVPGECYLFLREHEQSRVLVALNFARSAERFSVPGLGGHGAVLVDSCLERTGETVQLDDLYLRPQEGLVIRL